MSRFIKTFSRRLAATHRLPPRARAVALGEALAVASPDEAEAFATELLDLAVLPTSAPRGWAVRIRALFPAFGSASLSSADSALEQLASAWRQLPPGCAQAALAVGDERWELILPRLSTNPSGRVRLSLAALVGVAGDARLASIAAGMLHDQDAGVGEEAERSLVSLALCAAREDLLKFDGCARFIASAPPEALALAAARGLKGGADELGRHVADAVMTFGEHRRRGPVIAAMLLAARERTRTRGPGARALAAWLRAVQHPSHSVLRSVLRWSRAPVARLRALEWLVRDGLAIASAERLVRGRSVLEHELVLSNSCLLARPLRVARLAGFRPAAQPAPKDRKGASSESTFPTPGALRLLSPGARAGLTRFVNAWPIGARTRGQALAPLIGDQDPAVRCSAMLGAGPAALREFCFDSHAAIARAAFLRTSTAACGVTGAEADAGLLGKLKKSPHAEVRAWSLQELDRSSTSAALLHGRIALRRALQHDRAAFINRVRSDLRAVNASVLLSVLAEVRALGLAQDSEEELLALAAGEHADPRVTATAVALLTNLTAPRGYDIAEAQARHADGRVRANAVEALTRLARRAGRPEPAADGVIIELKADPHHRVRANAVRAAITGSARDLGDMLSDERPMHRVAGMWVLGRLLIAGPRRVTDAWPELAARVADLARFDPDPAVRLRAGAAAGILQAQVRASWQSPVTP